ncbi:uncharacterized protein BXZ73DRAFT_50702 [Epithele typhae]|uniref:uncharacterized protein n=1 Tax=Epithele typhae TaxID=378194 RepID=UPI002008713C|nr:uncharacterized protein BXZ73DRAFT_50702 [Epithele typhae]KAH9923967.1 hypothetical protein BXZ73DRAFT_50702 [Epithele typhae]
MSLFSNGRFNGHLAVSSSLTGKGIKRDAAPARNETNPDAELDLELTFAFTMSLNSPPTDSRPLTPEAENPNHVPMDVSPAPPAATGRKPNVSVSSSKRGTGTGSGKRLQRAALPTEWFATSRPRSDKDAFSQPVDIPSSPADRMDVDTSSGLVPSSPAPGPQGLPSAVPTVTTFKFAAPAAFNLSSALPSTTPTVTTFKNLFFETPARELNGRELANATDFSGVTGLTGSQVQPFPKKRRSSSPDSRCLRPSHHHLAEDEGHGHLSSPAQSSPTQHKLERVLANQKRPTSLGIGMPTTLALNANKKRPHRPTLSAMIAPGEGPMGALSPQPATAHPMFPTVGDGHSEHRAPRPPPARRAFSAVLPPNLLDQTMSSEASFEEDLGMSSPAQAYAKRQQMKTIRRCDGADDFPPTGATALTKCDNEVLSTSGRSRRHSDENDQSRSGAERDTPRSKYLTGLGGFGDNEAHGKILPCHRVREDGLMRINPTTLNKLLDGAYDSKINNYHIIDCRFDYEYLGGHIPGAININTTAGVEEFLLGLSANKPEPSTSSDPNKKTILVFHCEFSVKRAPTFAKHLRSKDRAMNNHVYPRVHFPELYVLEGGYSGYFHESGGRCQPQAYVRMDDPHYAQSRREDLGQFRKAKFGRTKSYAYGEGNMFSMTGAAQQVQAAQPKRNTAPSGGLTTLFAAANIARTRRAGLRTIAEGPNSPGHGSDGDDTDIGDSPCPPPTKNVASKGKKIGRAPLARAETYGPSRMNMGF